MQLAAEHELTRKVRAPAPAPAPAAHRLAEALSRLDEGSPAPCGRRAWDDLASLQSTAELLPPPAAPADDAVPAPAS